MRNQTPTFRLCVPHDQFPLLVEQYLSTEREMIKERAAMEAGRRIARGDIDPGNLQPIVLWKAARSKGRVAGNKRPDVEDALRAMLAAKEDRTAMAVLMGLQGVQVPMASAILTARDPERFTVIDFRALEALGTKQLMLSVDYYLNYLNFCRDIASILKLTLRQFDQALWQWSHNKRKENSAKRH